MLSIGEVSKRTGLKVPTIRFYEQEGLIGPPPRTESGRRLYGDTAVRRLTFVRHARTLGFELPDIRVARTGRSSRTSVRRRRPHRHQKSRNRASADRATPRTRTGAVAHDRLLRRRPRKQMPDHRIA